MIDGLVAKAPEGDAGADMVAGKASEIWAPVKDSHAILQVAAIVEFSEPVTAIIWDKVHAAAQALAAKYALSEKNEIQSVVFEVKPGAAPEAQSTADDGVEFFRKGPTVNEVADKLTVEKNSFRIDTWQYVRWVQMQTFLGDAVRELLPIFTAAVVPTKLSLEYQDLFYGQAAGPADASLIVRDRSRYFDGTDLDLNDVFHSNRGWFEHHGVTRTLVNADIAAADAKGPIGVRRTIKIRTFESLRIAAGRLEKEAVVQGVDETLDAFERMHISLKNRLGDILTPDAQAMISLESCNG